MSSRRRELPSRAKSLKSVCGVAPFNEIFWHDSVLSEQLYAGADKFSGATQRAPSGFEACIPQLPRMNHVRPDI